MSTAVQAYNPSFRSQLSLKSLLIVDYFAAMYQFPAYTAPVTTVEPENDVNNTTVSPILVDQ